jgi:IS5 family transposase
MKQQTLAMAADQTFENHRKPTRRDEFLKTMEAIVPWSALCEVIEPHYPKAGNGRPPIGLGRMLRIHFIQHWFSKVGQELQARGFKVNTGTIVDATIIGAPSSTKNADRARDPEMHQTRKGQQWYFGMKLHIGVDSQSGLAHSAAVTAANVHDKHLLPDLLHGNEQRVYGDSAYASQKLLIASKAPRAKDFTNQRTRRAGGVVN